MALNFSNLHICDCPQKNQPNSHLVIIVEIPVLKVSISITSFSRVRLALFSKRTVLIDLLNLI